ncbi:IS21 family transposase [Dictyobacter formicarum]|uniref:IS21 family transposase n=1 Tax=Dictyobacter formicarum TaxID=2778368 RepID=A0ABQ3VP68_9CHLR|nr:IS21 family transposase [Dictyobacter formicarum]GHO87168.1 IS21 family transposase [Dictyobacter formicarum]
MNTIHELAAQGKSIQDIAISLGIARNTVRKYLRHPELCTMPHPRPNRHSKLDPFKAQVKQWTEQDHCYNCEAMLPRLLEMGYTGSLSVLKAFVHPLRPPAGGHYPIVRYETEPGEQVQFDWGEFTYEQQGAPRKVYGFTAVLCYSRMRFVTFVKRCDCPTMIRCLMEAFEYFGGLPKAALTDRMKSVLLEMEDKTPRWNARFADFMASIGVAPRICKPYTPQTKGKVERSVGFVKQSFWAGVNFTDIDDLNRQAHIWCERINSRVHRTTHERPRERREQEPLSPLPAAFAWERFATEERKVGWDGYVSYDGVLYGLPSEARVAGSVVQVRERHGMLSVWSAGQLLVELAKRPHSQDTVTHPDQFRTVAPAASLRERTIPLGHQRAAPVVLTRALAEYDQLCGLEVHSCNLN